MKIILITIISLILISCSEEVELKVGYVDNARVYEEFTLSKELNSKLENTSLNYKNYLDSLQLIITKKGATLDVNDSVDVVTYLKMKQYYEDQESIKLQETQELSIKYNEQIVEQLNSYVTEFGEKNEYKIILGANGQGGLLYADNTIDITDEVISYINSRYNGH